MGENWIYPVTVNQITKENGIKENGACPIMIKVP